MLKQSNVVLLGSGLTLVVVAVAIGTYIYFHPVASLRQASASEWTGSTTESSSTDPVPAGEKRYTSSAFHFTLLYPDDLVVNEYQEEAGGLTVTFRDEDGSNTGFQIYVTPYGNTTITPARFKLDESSGVIQNQTAIVIDGKPATMFYSTNAIMGDTREVWFINHGFLYEVTTYKELDSWLAQIMASWTFD